MTEYNLYAGINLSDDDDDDKEPDLDSWDLDESEIPDMNDYARDGVIDFKDKIKGTIPEKIFEVLDKDDVKNWEDTNSEGWPDLEANNYREWEEDNEALAEDGHMTTLMPNGAPTALSQGSVLGKLQFDKNGNLLNPGQLAQNLSNHPNVGKVVTVPPGGGTITI